MLLAWWVGFCLVVILRISKYKILPSPRQTGVAGAEAEGRECNCEAGTIILL